MKKPTTEEIIKRFKLIHGDLYDYSLVDYKNIRTKVKIICKQHGIFIQRVDSHQNGNGCAKCNYDKLKKTNAQFIEESNKIHNNRYNYSLTDYVYDNKKVIIICSIHGQFEQLAHDHIKGRGCEKCGGTKKLTLEEFIDKSIKEHGNKYDYSFVEYKNTKNKVKILCVKHGIFEQSPNNHLTGDGCPFCNESKGERKVAQYLDLNNIKYIRQKKFEGCKHKYLLAFDFYLPEYNLCIEYDGVQHFYVSEYIGGIKTLEYTKKCDNIKNNYCQDNNINLIRIKFNQKIENTLDSIFESLL